MSRECMQKVFDFSESVNELKGSIKEVLKEFVVLSKLQESAKKVSRKCRGSVEEVSKNYEEVLETTAYANLYLCKSISRLCKRTGTDFTKQFLRFKERLAINHNILHTASIVLFSI